jgi:hypothetical protein
MASNDIYKGHFSYLQLMTPTLSWQNGSRSSRITSIAISTLLARAMQAQVLVLFSSIYSISRA